MTTLVIDEHLELDFTEDTPQTFTFEDLRDDISGNFDPDEISTIILTVLDDCHTYKWVANQSEENINLTEFSFTLADAGNCLTSEEFSIEAGEEWQITPPTNATQVPGYHFLTIEDDAGNVSQINNNARLIFSIGSVNDAPSWEEDDITVYSDQSKISGSDLLALVHETNDEGEFENWFDPDHSPDQIRLYQKTGDNEKDFQEITADLELTIPAMFNLYLNDNSGKDSQTDISYADPQSDAFTQFNSAIFNIEFTDADIVTTYNVKEGQDSFEVIASFADFNISAVSSTDVSLDPTEDTNTITFSAQDYESMGEDKSIEFLIMVDEVEEAIAITVNITDVNEKPTHFNLDNFNVDENTTEGHVANIIEAEDPDANDTLTYTVTGGADGQHFTTVLSMLHFDVGFTPNHEESSPMTVKITATDKGGLSLTQSFDITINDINDAPTANADTASVDEDGSVVIELTGSDDDGNTLMFSLESVPTHGSVSVDGSSATYTPSANYNGNDSFTFIVRDGELSDSATLSLTVNAVNDAPVLAAVEDFSFDEDTTTSITLDGTDIDSDDLTYSVSGGTEITAEINGDEITFTASENFNGSETFTAIVNDESLADTEEFIVSVNAVNDAPVLESIADVSFDENGSTTITLIATDVDDDDLIYAASDSDHITSSVSLNEMTFTPEADWFGIESIELSVSDDELQDTQTIQVTVIDVPEGETMCIGDINEDGSLNVIDVVSLINIVLSGTAYAQQNDVTDDGFVNVIDVVALINMVLSAEDCDL